jgi:hypothetical protein
MANLTSFIQGVLGNEMSTLETSDHIKLKDLLEQEIGPSLEEYNARANAIASLLCFSEDGLSSIASSVYMSSTFGEIGEDQQPPSDDQADVWKRPAPLRRFGAGVFANVELVKTSTSKMLLEYHYAKLRADQDLIAKKIIQILLTKTPTARVDIFDKKATTPLAFWNDESGMDIPPANGQITFDGDHQHFNANFTNTADTLGTAGDSLNKTIAKVTEHFNENPQILLWVRTQGTVSGLIEAETTYFRPINDTAALLGMINPAYQQSGIIQALIRTVKVIGGNIKSIGTWKNAVVLTTPDLVDNYVACTAFFGENSPKNPIYWRNHPAFKGLMMTSGDGTGNPVVGRDAQYRRYLGLGVNNRSAGASTYTHHATVWADATFA